MAVTYNVSLSRLRSAVMLRSYHGSNIIVTLQVLHNLGLMGWLHTGKAASPAHGLGLFVEGQIVKLTSGVGPAGNVLLLGEDANATADSDSGSLVVTWRGGKTQFGDGG